MDLFKLQSEISITIDKAAQNLTTLGDKANQVAEVIEKKVAKPTQSNIETNKSISALEKLNLTINKQETELQQLKEKYTDVILTQGKNSKEAKELASQISKLSNELKENKTKLDNASSSADKFDKNLNDISDTTKKVGDGFTVLKGTIANLLAQGISRLAQATTSLISGATQYQSSLEQYNTSFEVMTGSSEKAAEVTKKLGEVAAKTPFEMTTLADTTQLLMNYGLTADESIEKMTMLGDISQGNADKMGRIAMAYGQMSSAGKVSLEDVKQMIEAGFNPLQEISQTTGESMASLYDRISKGKISVDEITASMERSTAEGGKYFGSMDKQSQTLAGKLSTLKDTVNQSLGTALSGVLDMFANKVLPKITEALEKVNWEELGEKVGKLAEKVLNFGTWVIDNFGLISSLITAIGVAFLTWKVVGMITSLITAIKGLGTAMTVLNAVMKANVIGIVITAIAGLVTGFVLLWNKCEGFRNFWIGLWEGIKATFNGAVKIIKAGIDKIKSFFNFTLQFKGIKLPKIGVEWVQKPAWLSEAAKFLGMKGVPKFNVKWNEEGAIFTKPTIFNTANGLQGVGEAGAEGVLPIAKMQDYVSTAVRNENTLLESRMSRMVSLMENFFPQVLDGMDKQIVLDNGVLVGQLAKGMDNQLGRIYNLKERARQ